MAKYDIEVFARTERLSSLPEVSLRLVRLAQEQEPDFGEAAKLISGDPALCGRILKTVNSANFGLRSPVQTIREALPRIGLTLMRTLVLGFHLAESRSGDHEVTTIMKDFWRSCVAQAAMAQLIAKKAKAGDPSAYFLTGMLQDIGILAMLSEAADYYIENVLAHCEIPHVAAAERSCFGFSHVDISVEIVASWGLSPDIVHGILHHHDTSLPRGKAQGSQELNARVLRAAGMGAVVLDAEKSTPYAIRELHDYLHASFGFTSEQCGELIVEGNDRVTEFAGMFHIDVGEAVSNERILVEAKRLLQKIAVESQLQLLGRDIEPKDSFARRDHEIYIDSMTGVHNRRFLDETLQEEIANRRDTMTSIAVLFLDVDHFKTINDSFGHSAGDKAISHVASSLTASVRGADYVIRLGGDEFLVVLLDPSETAFESLAERIQQSIQPIDLDGEDHVITLSVGGVYYRPVPQELVDTSVLIDRADQLMYTSKRAGNGQCTLATLGPEDVKKRPPRKVLASA